jgi:hypothetical protein
MGGWRKLHNEEFIYVYSHQVYQNYQDDEDEMGEACSKNGGEKERV